MIRRGLLPPFHTLESLLKYLSKVKQIGGNMSANNTIVLVGRVGKDPDLQQNKNGDHRLEISLAVTSFRKDDEGNKETNWFNVRLYKKQAEIFSTYVQKGDLVSVSGSFEISKYTTKEGEQRSWYYVHAQGFQMLESKASKEGKEWKSVDKNAKKPVEHDDFNLDDDELPPF